MGHVLRMPNDRLPRRAMFSGIGVGWKKARGGQTKTCCIGIPRDLQPKELKPTMEFVHNVSMTLFSLNSNNNNNNNGHINNSTTTNYDSQ
ncbi:unnamed protein product [Schistosoma mattheei]|uniref:Uncharacterized protein n=1 Tax=Schistosoma mattheei TaxID=31246 RepID=A0A183Q4M0_9TREM|nr:unnamed protein product [Schistosoma mattheei]